MAAGRRLVSRLMSVVNGAPPYIEGFATMLPRWDGRGGVKTGCLCLALLHSVAFVEGERTHRRGRGGDGFLPRVGARGRLSAGMTGGLAKATYGDENGLRRERATTRVAPTGGGRGGRMDSCPVSECTGQALQGHMGMGVGAGNGQPQGLPLREGDGEGGWIPASAGMTGGLAKAT